ncbi:hypothetical protein QFZ22_009267 [Streptomyces canus]|uniref:Uncharacterized protein n=1 Tax=Streptomyces canus TaxID=58343 RepID=A0AAW8FW91_9ACTN|nr:hypothetical protein [Streptomyces canus]MDQ0913282.1 hypothetical protein [Streptomyces canus]
MASDRPRTAIVAWRPPVPGIAEVCPAHVKWDLMFPDDGSGDFARDRRRCGASLISASAGRGVKVVPSDTGCSPPTPRTRLRQLDALAALITTRRGLRPWLRPPAPKSPAPPHAR